MKEIITVIMVLVLMICNMVAYGCILDKNERLAPSVVVCNLVALLAISILEGTKLASLIF